MTEKFPSAASFTEKEKGKKKKYVKKKTNNMLPDLRFLKIQ